ncbi:MAG: trypsin-like peptidase domain-containing protein [Planctomycetota bacterium]
MSNPSRSRRRFAVVVVSVCQLVVFAIPGRAQDPALALEETVVKLVERIEPSVVSIARVKPQPNNSGFPLLPPERRPREQDSAPTDAEDPEFQPNDFGAGIIITPPGGDERLVLTNYHVVRGGPVTSSTSTDDGTSLIIRFADRRSCKASIIAADPRCDLAVLRLHFEKADMPPTDLKPLDWSSSSPIRKGQFVLMLGNPHALARDGSASVSWGMISNLTRSPLPWTRDRPIKVMLYRLGNLLQIDGRLNLGTSGGPVVNLKGELIGLTTSLAAVDGYEKSAGFAIPFDDLTRRIVKSLAAGQEVEYGMLGIGPGDVTPTQFRHLGIAANQGSAARVETVMRDSPADRAGLRPEDVILRVAGELALSEQDLMRLVGLHAPETEIELMVWRRGHLEPFPIKVKLGKWPVADDEGIIETTPRFVPWRGLSVDYPTGREKYSKKEFEPLTYRRAVVVIKVADESPTHVAGLQPGNFITHVNKVPVQTPTEFHAAIKSATGPVTLRLHADRLGEVRTVIVRE